MWGNSRGKQFNTYYHYIYRMTIWKLIILNYPIVSPRVGIRAEIPPISETNRWSGFPTMSSANKNSLLCSLQKLAPASPNLNFEDSIKSEICLVLPVQIHRYYPSWQNWFLAWSSARLASQRDNFSVGSGRKLQQAQESRIVYSPHTTPWSVFHLNHFQGLRLLV